MEADGSKWTSRTNWLTAHGSIHSTLTVDSEPDPEFTPRKSPLVLKPPAPHSGPCEIHICFQQKCEISQIYVRSTARVYEVYYARSPDSSREYLCTVRCGVAERDEKILQANSIGDVDAGEYLLREPTEETVTEGKSIIASEDEWVKIKVPEVDKCSVLDKINSNRLQNTQDLYEATAQISDADPCSLLTIRLLSLQDKGQVYVDEIYVFVDPVESIDSANETVLAESSSQSSLMAMFMPTLLQLSKPGVSRGQDKHASDEVFKRNEMDTESRRVDEIDVGLAKVDRVHQQNVKQKELNKDNELHQHASANTRVEIALEQLISRVGRMEDIFLRFEEKMVKPIESIEARLQKVEHQLEKLTTKDSNYLDLPRCTRISAPEFSCTESNSTSSLANEQSDYPPCGESEREEKGILGNNNTPELLSHDANFHPSLVVCAPEFLCEDDEEEDNDDVEPLKDSPCEKTKKPLSVDDALAAALNGFLSTSILHPFENTQTNVDDVHSKVDNGNQHQEHAESCQIKDQEFPDRNDGKDSSLYAQVLTVKAPDFNAEENGDVGHLNHTHSSSDMASVNENDENDLGDEMVPLPPTMHSESLFISSADSCDYIGSEKGLGNVDLNESFEVNTIDGYFDGDKNGCNLADNSNDSARDLAKDNIPSKLVLGHEPVISSEVLGRHVALEKCLKYHTSYASSLLDFEFPILEVKFASDVQTSGKSPLEALLDESNAEAQSVLDNGDSTGIDLLRSNLLDDGVYTVDGYYSNLEGEMNLSLDGAGEESNAQVPLVLDNGDKTETDLWPSDLFVDEGVPNVDSYRNLEGEMNASLI